MLTSVFFALSACFIWGFIFVVPEMMKGFSSIEVALGRYFVYGIVSSIFFLKSRLKHPRVYCRETWLKALFLSFLSTIGYYTFVVLALRLATPAICALILGICPISIAFYGNWRQREVPFKSLFIPSALILLGLLLINVPHLESTSNLSLYVLGLICSFTALITWSWYVVENARFLKQNTGMHSSEWTTLIGVATLFWTILLTIVLVLFFQDSLSIHKYFTFNQELTNFLLGSLILGLGCSWVGAALWNKGSVHLPVSLAGQLTLFETIFGVCFVYIFEQRTPPLLEITGIVLLLLATYCGLQQFSVKKTARRQLFPH